MVWRAVLFFGFSLSVEAAQFTGHWKGKCVNQLQAEITVEHHIVQDAFTSLTLDGFYIPLYDSMIVDDEQDADGRAWRSTSRYDWTIEKSGKSIYHSTVTRAWYVDQPQLILRTEITGKMELQSKQRIFWQTHRTDESENGVTHIWWKCLLIRQ